jgi:hypothetical protein
MFPARSLKICGAVLLAAVTGCRAVPQAKMAMGWRPVVSFSGRGDDQTQSFDMDSGVWRIKWTASNEDAPGTGSLLITVHSAVSGRPLAVAVDHKGIGKDIAYVSEEPRLFHLVIESAHVDWTASVEEAVTGEAAGSR